MSERARYGVLGVALGLGACLSCDSNPVTRPAAHQGGAAPDRLRAGESLPEAETAFGLPIPPGMRLSRQFSDAAYFTGELSLDKVLEHIQGHILSRDVEMMRRRTVFARAHIKGDAARRLVRIEVASVAKGSQLYIKDITPPPTVGRLPDAELWRQAGRNPDGTLLDENQVY